MPSTSSKQLVKFVDDKATLSNEGLELLRSIKGKICPVIFIGDGRAGKSYLASCVAGQKGAFFDSDTAESVTDGIDIVTVKVGSLLAGLDEEAREKIPAEDVAGETLLLMDCEGGNNAMAAIHTLVNVFGIVVGTTVVFVAAGMISEASLQNLGASLAARTLIKVDGTAEIEQQHLMFVVNKNMLRYEPTALEDLLRQAHDDAQRAELRECIQEFFTRRSFLPIPLFGMPDFDTKITELQTTILRTRKPFTMGGTCVDGASLTGLLELIVKEIRNTNEVSFPSMHRYVILDGFLLPTVDRLMGEASTLFPKLEDYDARLRERDPTAQVKHQFNELTSHIQYKHLVDEARNALSDRLNSAWQSIVDLNEAYGDQVKEMVSETREVELKRSQEPFGGRGLLSKVGVRRLTMRVDSRAAIYKKRGGDPEFTDWSDTNTVRTRLLESALEDCGGLPVLRGKLAKVSPSVARKVLTLGLSTKLQERACVLRDGHFLWWEPENLQDSESNGCLNFFTHRAIVEPVPHRVHSFVIKPANRFWEHPTSFSGGGLRVFEFDAEASDVPAQVWMQAIRRHTEFADAVVKQLGPEKALREIQVKKLMLKDVDST